MKTVNLWIKPHIRLIDTQFHATFMAFETGFFIKEPAPIFFSMAQVCEISWWNHISDYHLVLKPYNFICCQFPPLRYADVLTWKSTFNLGVNEDDFSVQIERHRCFTFHDITQHAPFHSNLKCHYEKLTVVSETAVGFIRYGRHWRDRIETAICVISKAHTKPVRCMHRVYDVRDKVYKPHRLVWEYCRDISEWKSRVTKSTVLQDLGRMMPTECRDEADCVSNWAVGANWW